MSESWLIIETSSRVGQVGVARGDGIVQAAKLDESRRHARDLAATVDRLLQAEGLTPRGLTGVMVGIGPGSYTGLRVGVISAKTLAYATGCRLIAVPTFAAIAEQSPAEAQQVWVIADALQGMVYLQRFDRGNDGWVPGDDLRIVPAADELPRLPTGAWLSGPGVNLYAGKCPQAVVVPEADHHPRIESVYWAGRRLPAATREELFRLEPLYLRGSSAEEKAKREGRA